MEENVTAATSSGFCEDPMNEIFVALDIRKTIGVPFATTAFCLVVLVRDRFSRDTTRDDWSGMSGPLIVFTMK